MKPALFNTEMVQAILAGRKTQTRRVIKFPEGTTGRLPENGFYGKEPYLFYPNGIMRPKYSTGDILYVRETWAVDEDLPYGNYIYRADDENPIGWCAGYSWRPSIHMPKEAARIYLHVTDVRIERLQDITPYGAWLEGCRVGISFSWEKHIPELQQMCRDVMFKNLWDSTIKKSDLDRYGWSANPWVWVITFERCEKPGEGV